MKRKILFGVLIVLIVVTSWLFLKSDDIVSDSIVLVKASEEVLENRLSYPATILSTESEIKLPDTTTSILVKENDVIVKDSKIANYTKYNEETLENENKDYLSDRNGIVKEVIGNTIVVIDRNYYGSLQLPIEKYRLVNNETPCTITSDIVTSQGKVIYKSEIGYINDGITEYEVRVKGEYNDYLLNQKVHVTFDFGSIDCYKIDKEAIITIETNSYLMKEEFKNDIGNYANYLIPVSLIKEDDNYAYFNCEEFDLEANYCLIIKSIRDYLK